MEVFRIFGSIFLKSDEADKTLDKIDKKAKQTDVTFSDMAKSVAKWGAVVGTGALAVGGAVMGVATKASETASRVADLSAKIGISTKGFQEWDYVLSQAGVDVSVLQGGFKKFAGAIDEASKGGEKQTAIFNELGISLTDTNGKVKSTEQLFNESVSAFTKMEQGAHKTALANTLFGKSSMEMGAILNGTAKDLEDAKNKANELGLVMSEDAVSAGDQLGDTMDNVKKSFGAMATAVGVQVMPMLQKLLDWILAKMPVIQSVTSVAFGAIQTAIKYVVDAVQTLTAFFQKHWGIVQPILTGLAAGAAAIGLFTLALQAATVATTIATTATAAFGAVVAFLTSPIGIAVVAITGLVAAITYLWKTNETFRNTLLNIWDSIKKAAENIFGSIQAFWAKWGGSVTGIFKDTFEILKILVLAVFNDIQDFWRRWGPYITEFFKFTFNNLIVYFKFVWDTLKNVVGVAIGLISNTIKLFLSILKGDWEGAWNAIKGIFVTIWDGIKTQVSNVTNAIKGVLSNFTEFSKNIFYTAWNGVKDTTISVWNGIATGIKSAINNIIGYINGMISKVAGGINAVSGFVSNIPGVNIPKVTAPKIPMLATGGEVTGSGRVLVGERGPEFLDLPKGARVTPIGAGDIKNEFNIASLIVREEADIKLIARELYKLQQTRNRGLGVPANA